MEYPKRLYKYLIPDRTDILNNNLIRFTQPSALNDPFELNPIFFDLFSENQLKKHLILCSNILKMLYVKNMKISQMIRKHKSQLNNS